MNKLCHVGIDLAKNVFQLHGVHRYGKAVWRRRLTRDKWLRVLLEKIEPGLRDWYGGLRRSTPSPYTVHHSFARRVKH